MSLKILYSLYIDPWHHLHKIPQLQKDIAKLEEAQRQTVKTAMNMMELKNSPLERRSAVYLREEIRERGPGKNIKS